MDTTERARAMVDELRAAVAVSGTLPLMVEESNIEAIGRLADKADNFAAAAQIPFPPKIHAEQLAAGMEEISQELKRIYIEVTGENPWG